MRRRGKAGGKVAKAQRRKTLTRRNKPDVPRHRKSSAAEASARVALLEHGLNEALAQQAATADVFCRV
jgi:hypothetical protein